MIKFIFVLLMLSGCVTQQQVNQVKTIIKENKNAANMDKISNVEHEKIATIRPEQNNTLAESTNVTQSNPEQIKNDLDFVEVWKDNKSVKDWKVTTTLKVDVKPMLYFQTTQNWQPKHISDKDGELAGNIWVIAKFEGKWTASTFEWFRQGKNFKKSRSVIMEKFADHAHFNHIPQVGEKVYFFVSGLIRTSARNIQERSEVQEAVL